LRSGRTVIFVTVGTTHFPFDRLVEAIAALPLHGEELIVQRGASRVQVPRATVSDFLPFGDVEALVRRSRVVVSHAGVGSIMVALAGGKRPIVVPRLARFGEAVDDHQVGIASLLAAQLRVVLAKDVAELPSLLATHPPPSAEAELPPGPLVEIVAQEARRALKG
jgi:UDP-N-acetylglucosamine transferase subunit ALG13